MSERRRRRRNFKLVICVLAVAITNLIITVFVSITLPLLPLGLGCLCAAYDLVETVATGMDLERVRREDKHRDSETTERYQDGSICVVFESIKTLTPHSPGYMDIMLLFTLSPNVT